MTTRSRTTIATNPRAVRIQTAGGTAVNTNPPKGRQGRRFRRSLPSRVLRTSSTGDADEAFRDDDTAAKEYSPSSGRRVADDRRPGSLPRSVRILTRAPPGGIRRPVRPFDPTVT